MQVSRKSVYHITLLMSFVTRIRLLLNLVRSKFMQPMDRKAEKLIQPDSQEGNEIEKDLSRSLVYPG